MQSDIANNPHPLDSALASFHTLKAWGWVAGLEGVGSIFMRAPQLMLCKPTTNDRWDRRAVELAYHAYKHGDCNVSEVIPPPPPISLLEHLCHHHIQDSLYHQTHAFMVSCAASLCCTPLSALASARSFTPFELALVRNPLTLNRDTEKGVG